MATYEKQTVSEDNRPDQVDVDGQTYLRVAETVLAKALSPLKAREIVERGIEQGLFGDHVMGRTPEKSMQARLSIDILTRAGFSRFVRTARGRFALRASVNSESEPAEEYVAERRVLNLPKEEVLCAPEANFRDVLTFQGIDPDSASILKRILTSHEPTYIARTEAETRDDAKQFITYVLVQCGERLLFFKRSYLSRAAEFLRGSKCIGFGGHVSAADVDMWSHEDYGLAACARRELAEEISLQDRSANQVANNRATIRLFQDVPLERLGILNDDSSEVGRRHVAVVYRAWISDWNVAKKLMKGDSSIKGISWIDLSKDTLDISDFEYWSQLCLRKFYPSTLIAKARLQVLNSSRLTKDHLLVVAGRVGSGKSETSTYLGERLSHPVIRTGELVRTLMNAPSIAEIGREEFQKRAFEFISGPNGPNRLAQAILRQVTNNGGRPCIVDGVRNLQTFEKLESLYHGGDIGLIYIQTPPDVAFDMYRAREAQGTLSFSYRDFLKVYDAPVESKITSLGRKAHAIVYNSFGMEAFRRTLDDFVSRNLKTPIAPVHVIELERVKVRS